MKPALDVSAIVVWLYALFTGVNYPESKVREAYMGPTCGRQDPGGPHVGPINLAIRVHWTVVWLVSWLKNRTSLTQVNLLPHNKNTIAGNGCKTAWSHEWWLEKLFGVNGCDPISSNMFCHWHQVADNNCTWSIMCRKKVSMIIGFLAWIM